MTFSIKLADQTIRIDSIYESTYYKSLDFHTDRETADIFIKTQISDIQNEKQLFCGTDESVNYAGKEWDNGLFEDLAIQRQIAEKMISFGVLLMHGALVAVNENGYLFIAPSGTGKTTHAKLWIDNIDGAYIVNGDKPLIKMQGDNVYAYGTPWAGKEGWKRNCKIQLKAICILERKEENSIEEISFENAYITLLKQSFIPQKALLACSALDLIDQLKGKIRFYKLRCNVSVEAARLSFAAMNSPIN